MFATSFLAGPRFIALRAILMVFLPAASPLWLNTVPAAPLRQSGKPADRQQEKDLPAEKGLTAEAKAIVRNAVPAVGAVMAKEGAGINLSYRGSAVVVRGDGIVVTSHHVIYNKESEKVYDGLYLRLNGGKENGHSKAVYKLEVIISWRSFCWTARTIWRSCE
jgi:hypothetical protein